MSEPKKAALYKCNQTGCPQPGLYRFTWPGKNEAFICEIHVHKLRDVAEAMGIPLQIITIFDEWSAQENGGAA